MAGRGIGRLTDAQEQVAVGHALERPHQVQSNPGLPLACQRPHAPQYARPAGAHAMQELRLPCQWGQRRDEQQGLHPLWQQAGAGGRKGGATTNRHHDDPVHRERNRELSLGQSSMPPRLPAWTTRPLLVNPWSPTSPSRSTCLFPGGPAGRARQRRSRKYLHMHAEILELSVRIWRPCRGPTPATSMPQIALFGKWGGGDPPWTGSCP